MLFGIQLASQLQLCLAKQLSHMQLLWRKLNVQLSCWGLFSLLACHSFIASYVALHVTTGRSAKSFREIWPIFRSSKFHSLAILYNWMKFGIIIVDSCSYQPNGHTTLILLSNISKLMYILQLAIYCINYIQILE